MFQEKASGFDFREVVVRDRFDARWFRSRLIEGVTAVILVLAATQATAHRMDLSVRVVGNELHGTATFHGARPAVGAAVEVRDPLGEVLARAVTGEDGRFQVPLTRRVPLEVVVEAADGHLARRSVSAEALPPELPTAAEAAAAAQTESLNALAERLAGDTASQLAPIHDRLAELEQRIWLRDVLGGVGYILGLAGVAAYMLSRRRRGPAGRADS